MFGNGIIFTDAPENIKDIMLTRVRNTFAMALEETRTKLPTLRLC